MESRLHRVESYLKTELEWCKFCWLCYVAYLGMRANATLWNVIEAWCEHGEQVGFVWKGEGPVSGGVLCARVCWMFLEFFAALWLLLLVY
jgi:hypothetical protein